MNKYSNKLLWYALYTYSNHEKKVQFYLDQRKIESFLPFKTEIRQWSDRKKKVVSPLFPGYLFVRIDKHHIWEVANLPGAIRLIGAGDTPESIPDKVIDSIQKIVSGKVEVGHLNMRKGEKVKVTAGPFAGVEGKFIKIGAKRMLVVEIELLKRSIILELDSLQIQRLEKIVIENNRQYSRAC
ncbi:MAG: UpxY family transcription antiterminator [Bacteroidota bacterium]